MLTRAEIARWISKQDGDFYPIEKLELDFFVLLIAYLLESTGYEVTHLFVPPNSPSNIVARYNTPSGSVTTVVGCKKCDMIEEVLPEEIHRLHEHARNQGADRVMLVTPSDATRRAEEVISELSPPVFSLVDGRKFLDWLSEVAALDAQRYQKIITNFGDIPPQNSFSIQPLGSVIPQEIVLPPEYRTRIEGVRNIPLDIIQRVAKDPRTMFALGSREFEEFIAELVSGIGFNDVVLTPRSRDGGKDVVASRMINGIPVTFYFECKKYAQTNKVQLDTMRSLLGAVAHDATKSNIGVLVTTSRFTRGCHDFMVSERRISGRDYSGLVEWTNHYAQRYRFDRS